MKKSVLLCWTAAAALAVGLAGPAFAEIKIGSSLAFGVGYFIVGRIAGFHPREENSEASIFGLVLVFGLLPGLLYISAGLLARTYPLTRAVQEETARRLETRIVITDASN